MKLTFMLTMVVHTLIQHIRSRDKNIFIRDHYGLQSPGQSQLPSEILHQKSMACAKNGMCTL